MGVQFEKTKEQYKGFIEENESAWEKAIQFPKRWGKATRAEFKEVYGAAKKHREEMLQTISDSVNVKAQLGEDNQKFIDEWNNATFENRDKLLAGASKSMQDYISTVGDGKATWEGFIKYQQNAAEQIKATSLSARAAAVGMKILKAAMSMAIMALLMPKKCSVPWAATARMAMAEEIGFGQAVEIRPDRDRGRQNIFYN